MEKDLISVIVPIYNVEKYLDECVQSILNQSYHNIEIILVDDGSKDRSSAICDKYAEADKRVRVIHKLNGGLSDARNAGTAVARGKYITFVDSDDLLDLSFVELSHKKIKEYDADMVIMPNVRFKSKSPFPYTEAIGLEVHNGKYCISKMLQMNLNYHTGGHSKLIKRDLCLKYAYPYGKYYEDLATTYKMWIDCEKVVCLDSPLYGYRLRDSSIMTEHFSIKKMDCVSVAEVLFSDISERYPEFKGLVSGRCLSICSNVFLQIPSEQFLNEQKILWSEIRKYRKYVLLSINARRKAWFAAVVSLFGKRVYRIVFSIYRKRSKQYMVGE